MQSLLNTQRSDCVLELMFTKLFLIYIVSTVKQVHGGCLIPFSQPFLEDASYFAKFLPKDGSLRSYEFDTCTGDNCFDISSGKEIVLNLFQ